MRISYPHVAVAPPRRSDYVKVPLTGFSERAGQPHPKRYEIAYGSVEALCS
jgi:hypothetical protein